MCAAVNQIPPVLTSPSDTLGKVQLIVTTGDKAAEVFVVDGDLQLRARGVGKLDTKLNPGIYKVRVRTGLSSQEDYVVLRDVPVRKFFSPLKFSTPVPLVDTAKSHEYHQQAAVDRSRNTDVILGAGSSIFIFARDWNSTPQPPTLPPANPASGLRLKSIDGTVLADIEQKAVTSQTSDSDPTHDPWAACTIAVSPGAYRLCVETSEGEIDQTIIAPPGWHVHVFLLQHSFGVDQKQKGPDLTGAAIMLSQTQQFTPDGDEARSVELARLGLTEQREILSDELLELLTEKFNDPMLGIFAGHLMLLEPSPDLKLLKTVVNNLRALVSFPHPDVEALALRLEEDSPAFQFSIPPMLRRSWSMILDASADQKAVVVRGSAAADIIGRVCSVDPWLLWAQPAAAQTVGDEQRTQDSFRDALDDHLEHAEKSTATKGQSRGFSFLESALDDVESILVPKSKSVTESQVRQLVRSLGAPRFYVEDLLKDSGFTFPEKVE